MAEKDERCMYFLTHKGRCCRMMAIAGSVFCGEHLIVGQETDLGKCTDKSSDVPLRIVCPLDPSHTVFEHLLKKHLKKCNAAKRIKPVCYVENVNTGIIGYCKTVEEQMSLGDYDSQTIEHLIKQVDIAYTNIYEDIEVSVLTHPILNHEISDDRNGPSALKHLIQQSSILGHMESHNLLGSNSCYLEFGAGRGKLSHWIQQALSNDNTVHYTLIDRANCRRKMDLYHRFEEQGPKFERLLIDIEHLDLERLECLQSGQYKRVIGISKHLCGAATDLTLRCLTQYNNQHSSSHKDSIPSDISSEPVSKRCHTSSPSPPPPPLLSLPLVSGIVIALCCHQRCDWQNFFGCEVLSELGFNSLDFHLISHMTSWGVCGVRPRMGKKQDEKQTDTNLDTKPFPTRGNIEDLTSEAKDRTELQYYCNTENEDRTECRPSCKSENEYRTEHQSSCNTKKEGIEGESFSSHSSHKTKSQSSHGTKDESTHSVGYIPHPKETIGLKCKRILDYARIRYLRQHGYDARLIYYTDKSISLENVLLVAVPRQ